MDEQSAVFARFYPFLDRFVELEFREDVLLRVSFGREAPETGEADHGLLDRIEDYLTGTSTVEFTDVAVDLTAVEDHRPTLEAIREIPYGESASVDEVAQRYLGMETVDEDTRAEIRESLAANPVPLVIPDHRVRDGPSGAPPRVEQRLRSVEQAGG